jgi:hypothetical protein
MEIWSQQAEWKSSLHQRRSRNMFVGSLHSMEATVVYDNLVSTESSIISLIVSCAQVHLPVHSYRDASKWYLGFNFRPPSTRLHRPPLWNQAVTATIRHRKRSFKIMVYQREAGHPLRRLCSSVSCLLHSERTRERARPQRLCNGVLMNLESLVRHGCQLQPNLLVAAFTILHHTNPTTLMYP